MRRTPNRPCSEDGFTILEVVIAATILIVGVLATLSLLDRANAQTVNTRAREGATNLARELVEQVRTIPYGQLTTSTIVPKLQAQPGLGNDTQESGDWTIHRRSFPYTASANICTVDDPKNGVANSPGQDFCTVTTSSSCSGQISVQGGGSVGGGTLALCLTVNGSVVSTLCGVLGTGLSGTLGLGGLGGSATICPASTALDNNPNNYKIALLKVAWGGNKSIQQLVLIPNPGSGAGPAIQGGSLIAVGLTANVLTSNISPITVNASTTLSAQSVNVWIDGAVVSHATGSGTSWTYAWNVSGVVDGTYVVGMQALDSSGQTGPITTQTITLNRFAPIAPTGFVGGRNGTVVDFEWNANSERDIVGYRVYQDSPAPSRLVCDVTQELSCIDNSPPAGPLLTYHVVALDRDPQGNLREGASSAPLTVTNTNLAPRPPTSLAASTSSGATVLSWLAPVPTDLDGDAIAFYRIYRDGITYDRRYDRLSCATATCTYTDARPAGATHTYYVTAVDANLAESPAAGPVTQ